MFALWRSLFNEHNKSSNLLGIVTWSVLGKQNRQAKKVYSDLNEWKFYHLDICKIYIYITEVFSVLIQEAFSINIIW